MAITCKFHHPLPAGVQVPTSVAAGSFPFPIGEPFPLSAVVPSPASYRALQSPFVHSIEQYGMDVAFRFLLGSYGFMLFFLEMVPMRDWTPCPICILLRLVQCLPNVASTPAYTGPFMSLTASPTASSNI
ncbi:hypothetical protein FXO37_19291 [Capsicum annuum]|nr:hypothetical protein FXO37_19291 [Capsicum annuum]